MTKPTRATPESGSTPLSSRVDPILTPAKAEREAAANRSVDTSDTLKQTVTKATPSVSDETLALFGRRNDFATRYHLTRRGKIKRLGQITRIVEQFDVLHGLTPVKMRLMFEALGPTFVKVGQILSMRSEILPQSFCDELAKLRADAEFHGVGCACRRIRASRRRGVRAYRSQAVGLCFTGASASRHAENRRRCGH